MASDGFSEEKGERKTAAGLSTKTMCVVSEGDGYGNLVCCFWN